MNTMLLLYTIVILGFLSAILRIILGICGSKKSTKYNGGDVILGIISIVLFIIVLNT